MQLVKEVNGVPHPYSLNQLYLEYSHISWPRVIPPEMLAGYNIYYVHQMPMPIEDVDYDPYMHEVRRRPLTKTKSGNYILDWEVIDKPSEQMKKDLRAKRDKLLLESDGLLLRLLEQYDFDIERITSQHLVSDMKLYRQALRDVPQQASWPYDLEWPIKPQ